MPLLRALFSALVLFALAAPASAQIYGNSGMRAGNVDLPPRGGYSRPMRGGYGWPMRGRGFGMAPGLLLLPLAAGAARAAAQPVDEPPPRLRHKPSRKKIARAPTRPAPKPPVAANALLNLPPPGETRLVAREALVVFKPGVSPGRIAALARRQKWETAQFRDIALLGQRVYRLRAVEDRPLGALLRALARDPAVASVQPHYVYALDDDVSPAPQIPAPPAEHAMPPSYAPVMLHLPEAHRIAGGKAVRMALIDTAIDATHPEIAGSVAASFDASGATAAPGRHGLGMASAIAGHKQIDGAAPQAQLLAARAFDETADGSRAVGLDVLAALDWAVTQKARIVNMSFSGPADPLLATMLAAAAARKVILVAAAGNDGAGAPPAYPGADPHVIAVSALDAQSRLYDHANRGAYVALAAPGVDVLVAAPAGAYDLTSGTSVACAEISGIAALLLEKNPDLDGPALRRILRDSAHALKDVPEAGAGLADASTALQRAR